MCIHGGGNIFTEPLPNSDRGIHIQTDKLMGGIYEVRQVSYKDWYRHSKVDGRREITDSMMIS
jgi:hypothetical protein